MRFWTLLSGVALGLAIGAAARDGWMAVLFGVGAAFFWRASYCFPAEAEGWGMRVSETAAAFAVGFLTGAMTVCALLLLERI